MNAQVIPSLFILLNPKKYLGLNLQYQVPYPEGAV